MYGEYGTSLGPYNVRQPIPFIEDLSVNGVLSIGWDRGMTQRDDYDELNPSRVATVPENASSLNRERRRNLIYRHEGFYKNETAVDTYSEGEWLLILEALELRVLAGEQSDSNSLNLTWEVYSFSKQRL